MRRAGKCHHRTCSVQPSAANARWIARNEISCHGSSDGVFHGNADHLRGIDDPGFDQIDVFLAASIEAFIASKMEVVMEDTLILISDRKISAKRQPVHDV